MAPLPAALLLAAAAAAPCSTEYFPLTLGSEWEYRLETDVGAPVGRSSGTTKLEVIRAAPTSVSLSHEHRTDVQHGRTDTTRVEIDYICTSEGPVVARDWTRFGAVTAAGSETPHGMAPGLRWPTWAEVTLPRRVVVKTDHEAKTVERVTVRAGTFDALRVDFVRLEADDPQNGLRVESRGSSWYARGVGPVRYRAETISRVRGRVQGRATVLQELVSVRIPAAPP